MEDILRIEEIEEILEESRKEKYSDPRTILFGLNSNGERKE